MTDQPAPPFGPVAPSGADTARTLHDKAKDKEGDVAGHAKQLHEQGKAHGAKHGA